MLNSCLLIKIHKYTDSLVDANSKIIDSLIYLCLKRHNLKEDCFINKIGLKIDISLIEILKPHQEYYFNLENIIFAYEELIDNNLKSVKGITFTPKFICEHMTIMAFSQLQDISKIRIIDPACGGGIFLLVVVYYLKNSINKSIKDILRENIFGIDLVKENVEVTRKILLAACLLENPHATDISLNILCDDSLKINWEDCFHGKFDIIIGNPPYVNPHDLEKETINYLKKHYLTTSTGTTNIFYAFIENSMHYLTSNGNLCFIIPNNFITISAAKIIRKYLIENKYINYLIDFTDNMLFAPVRTYNAIILLDLQHKDCMNYSIINHQKIEELPNHLKNVSISTIKYTQLDNDHRWVLSSEEELRIISKIEGQFVSIKDCIKTGIATLRDDCYIVSQNQDGSFYKLINNYKLEIESEILRPLYKVSEINPTKPISDSLKYIIFPYKKNANGKYIIIPENILQKEYPNTYLCLLNQKEELDKRDKGKKNPNGWYAYGRSQGLNSFGNKILYPTFSSSPKFQLINDQTALFCNGYAIFEHDYLPLEILNKILNSKIMDFYIKLTSYPIEGGYLCYQKKYIERFSIPFLSNEEINLLQHETNTSIIDDFLLSKYEIDHQTFTRLYNRITINHI